jgi:hypothetical protein
MSTPVKSSESRKTAGIIMSAIGFLMIVTNALDYLLGWEADFTPLWLIGLVMVVIGMHMSRMD